MLEVLHRLRWLAPVVVLAAGAGLVAGAASPGIGWALMVVALAALPHLARVPRPAVRRTPRRGLSLR